LKVPAERPDKQAAARDPKGDARDRPGFDLGGAVEDENQGSTKPGGGVKHGQSDKAEGG
jgi:hypothetical protein